MILLVLAVAAPATDERTLRVGDAEREYRLHVAPDAERPMPLVIVLHGLASNGRQTEILSGFSEVADREGFAVAYPDGRQRAWLMLEQSADVDFLDALIDALVEEGVAARRRVYVCGISNGGGMTVTYARARPGRVAAAASIAGPVGNRGAEGGRAVPILFIHGTEDPIVNYGGGRDGPLTYAGAEDVARSWAESNRCETDPTVEPLPDAEDDDTTVERRTFAGDAEVALLKITGGGHTWPGGSRQPERLLGNVCRDIDASDEMWLFFARFALPE